MKILKNLFYLFIMIGITCLACQAKVKKLSPDEEILLLKNLVKEKTEAAHAEIEYWQKMGLVGGLIDAQVDEVREKTISPDAFNGLKTLKDPLFDLLASSERVGVKRLRERYESAKKALQIYAQDYIEDYVEEVPEAVSTEAVISVSTEMDVPVEEAVIVSTEKEVAIEGVAVPVEEAIVSVEEEVASIEVVVPVSIDNVSEAGISMGLPPTPELPPIISPEEKEEIIAVKEEEMKVKSEMFEIPPTPPSPGAPGMPAAPGMALPSEMGMGMEAVLVPEMGMGMMPEAPATMGMEGGMESADANRLRQGYDGQEAMADEMADMEMEEVEEEVEAPAMGMGMEAAPVPEMGMGMMPEVPVTMEEMEPSEMEEEEVEVPAMGMESAAQPSEMGMMPEEVMEEEVESADANRLRQGYDGQEAMADEMADMELEEAPSGMALGMESPVLTGLESFEKKYKNNINLAMNLLSDDD